VTEIKATLVHSCGDDLTTVNAARVSFDKSSGTLSDRDRKLIGYLADHKHTSPFGHAFATFKVDAPVFVARQLVKHKFLRMNEVSRRYVDTPPSFYSPDFWRGKSRDKKQGSSGVLPHQSFLNDQYEEAVSRMEKVYDFLLSQGVAPEQARMVLPQSMMTSWWWSGSLDAFADMCKLRMGCDAQAETREVALQIAEALDEIYPVSFRALLKE